MYAALKISRQHTRILKLVLYLPEVPTVWQTLGIPLSTLLLPSRPRNFDADTPGSLLRPSLRNALRVPPETRCEKLVPGTLETRCDDLLILIAKDPRKFVAAGKVGKRILMYDFRNPLPNFCSPFFTLCKSF